MGLLYHHATTFSTFCVFLRRRQNLTLIVCFAMKTSLGKETTMGNDVKYYIYLSDAKLDMLYPQIPKSLLKRIASELNISLKLLGAELTAGIKGTQSEETRYSKVRIVSKYIEEHLHLGTVDSPDAYFKGTLPMKWGLLPGDNFYTNASETGVVYFGGFSDQTIVGLGGTAH